MGTPEESAFQTSATGARGWRLTALVLGVPALIGWALLTWWEVEPIGASFRHADASGRAGYLPLVLVGWVVMVTAMMLPTTAPLIRVFQQVTRNRPDQARLISLVIGGYLAVWTAVGSIAIVGDDALHWTAANVGVLREHPRLIAATVFVLAGFYQFTALKRRCVAECRSPFVFIARRWRGGADAWNAFILGVDHGAYCVGCCWSLMLVVFAVGMANVGWMLLMGVVMAVEKNVARAAGIGPVLGFALLGVGGYLAIFS